MRILMLSHYYAPEVNAPASRTSEHSRAWARAGHRVTVVTCAPNHPRGKIYPGYRNWLFQREVIDGVEVVRLWTLLNANEGFLLRTLSYLSFLVAATAAAPFLPRPDVIVSTSPQFFCGLAGRVLRAVKRCPWVLEIRDLWPESIVSVGAMRKGLAIRFLEALEASAYRRADGVVVVADSFVEHVAERRRRREAIHVIKNGVDLDLFQPGDGAEIRARFDLGDRIVAAYVGTHGMAHGLDTLLDAAALLRDDPRIGFLLVGDGAERARLVERAREMRLDNVRIVGQLPKRDMPAVWSATDVSLILLRRTETFTKVLPSKMFEAMAMARPIALGVEGEAAALLAEAGAGLAVEPENAPALAAAVRRLAEDAALRARLGAAGAEHVRRHYDRAALALRYIDVLESAVAARRGADGARAAVLAPRC
ncbi:glycosyltransferase family 4 protein [Methylosinus trichosporium]|uniref:Glycosyltransferase WbuB n=2 Tax=Methylosinus TaxID=425 RepID=A0A2D2CVC6_METT3|nr:glycosyltransferase family 4 protein [Methylosinus trichosporium]ATQ66586.1 glycosyltransferase WbuB [Methylosinus trichosporium OB3b]